MERNRHVSPTRRTFLRICLAIPAPFVIAACGGQIASDSAPQASAAVQPTNALPTIALPAASQPASTQMDVQDSADSKAAAFNFVLPIG